MLLKCYTQYVNNWKTQQRLQNWKKSVFILEPKKGNAKECSNCCTSAHASKVMLKIFQAKLQQYMNQELTDIQARFRKDKGTRDQIANICWIIEKTREFQKNIYIYFTNYLIAFDCVDHNKLENSERDGNTRPPDLPLTYMQSTSCEMLSWMNHKLKLGLQGEILTVSDMQMIPF